MVNNLKHINNNCSDKLLFVGQASVALGTMLISLGLIMKFRGQVVVRPISRPFHDLQGPEY
jgi:hypothetical protein